jgi:hypothetical protein
MSSSISVILIVWKPGECLVSGIVIAVIAILAVTYLKFESLNAVHAKLSPKQLGQGGSPFLCLLAVMSKAKLSIFPRAFFLIVGIHTGTAERAVVDADPKTNNLLVNLLVKNIKRNASRQIEATLFGVNGEVIRKS